MLPTGSPRPTSYAPSRKFPPTPSQGIRGNSLSNNRKALFCGSLALGRRFGGGVFRHDGLHGHFRGCLRNLRSGFFRNGGRLRGRLGGGHFGFRDSGSHGRIRLRIFSRRADLLLGSRKCRFFSSHFSTRFWFPHVREHINLANITILCGTPKRFRQNMQQRRPPEARNRGIPARRRGFPVCPGSWSRVCSPLKPHSSPSDQRLRPFAAMRLGAA